MLNFFEILQFYGLFLPPFSGLDVHGYASRPEERRFLLKSAYPLKGAVSNLHLRQPLFCAMHSEMLSKTYIIWGLFVFYYNLLRKVEN